MEKGPATAELIGRLRRIGTDTTSVEVKAAAGGLPKSTTETLSAFANGSGGTLLLGLSEGDAFTGASGFDAHRIQDALAGVCADSMEPPVRSSVEIEEYEDGLVVRLDVPELDPVLKPCFIRARGAYEGSYIRGGDGDRRLTHFEVTQLLANRRQPDDDRRAVDQATLDDLDPELVRALVTRLRERSPRAFALLDETSAMRRLGVVVQSGSGELVPSMAGLLCLGRYPQQFLPQLFVSFVALPGTVLGEPTSDGRRFLDNQNLDGPLPLLVEDAVAAVERNLTRAAVVRGAGRADRLEYPVEVVRELLVNAVMHRDYSPDSWGTQVQIELYPDRLVVKSPGGLHGGVAVDELGVADVSSSRNATLARLLTEIPSNRSGQVVCENRGSGLPTVLIALRDAGMSPPEFDVTPAHVHVSIPRHALLDPETMGWFGEIGARDISAPQHLALAMVRSGGYVSNAMLRVWGVHSSDASMALSDLVARGMLNRFGGRRWATYELAPGLRPAGHAGDTVIGSTTDDRSRRTATELQAVTEAIRSGTGGARAIGQQLGLSYQTTLRRIGVLLEAGIIDSDQARNSRTRSYRLARPARTDADGSGAS